VNFFYEEGPGHGFNPVVSDINISNLIVESATQGLNLRGYSDDHIDRVTLRDIDFGTTTKPDVLEYVDHLVLDNVTENGEPVTPPAGAA
jgi:hypothetical protein